MKGISDLQESLCLPALIGFYSMPMISFIRYSLSRSPLYLGKKGGRSVLAKRPPRASSRWLYSCGLIPS